MSFCDAALRVCRASGYTNAATFEFLYDPMRQDFAFMEVNARLQVEHAVTELTSGLDLIQLQIHVARGGRLEGPVPQARGHAIEVRLNAEDPEEGFSAAPERVQLIRVPTRPGLRLDSGVAEGDEIPAEFDSMIAKLVAVGPDRAGALASLTQALRESAIVVAGGVTNRAFLLSLLELDPVRENRVDVDWLDRMTGIGTQVSREEGEVALLQAAIDVYDSEFAGELENFFASAVRIRPVIRTEAGRLVELRHRGHFYRFRVFRHSQRHYRVEIGGRRTDIEIDRVGRFEQWVTVGGIRYRVIAAVTGLMHLIEVNGSLHRISRDDSSILRATAPSVVTAIDVKVGESVAAGQRLALLEAMKMEMAVHLAFLVENPDAPDRGLRVQSLVDCPYPLMNLFAERRDRSLARLRRLMLEVMTRRYYRMHGLEDFQVVETGVLTHATACYDRDGKSSWLIAGIADAGNLRKTLVDLRPAASTSPGGGRWRTSSIGCTPYKGRWQWAPSTASYPPGTCAPT